jgi:hypothetical protein
VDIVSLQDYYPGGMDMPGRSYTAADYKFGYQGSLKASELGKNQYTTFFREMDCRIMRWWNPDPVYQPFHSPYNIMNNNVIINSDEQGNFATKFGAKVYAFFCGGTVHKTVSQGGKKKYGNYYVSKRIKVKYSEKSLKISPKVDSQGNNETKLPPLNVVETIVGSWGQGFRQSFGKVDFVFEVSGKISFDVGAKVKGSYGIASGEAKANLMSIELLSGSVDVTEIGNSKSNAFKGDYIGSGSGAKISQGISVDAGVAGRNVFGFEAGQDFRTHGEGYFDNHVNSGNFYFNIPVLKSKSSDELKDVLKDLNVIKKPTMSNPKINKLNNFYGGNVGLGASFILGADVNVKIGFNAEK